jgi:hypothetical protein
MYSMGGFSRRDTRFNEVYLAFRVEVDEDAVAHGVVKASDFAAVYEGILGNLDIRSSRVSVRDFSDMKDLKWAKKFPSDFYCLAKTVLLLALSLGQQTSLHRQMVTHSLDPSIPLLEMPQSKYPSSIPRGLKLPSCGLQRATSP